MEKFYEITQFLYFLFFFSRKNDDAKETKEESKEDAEEKEVWDRILIKSLNFIRYQRLASPYKSNYIIFQTVDEKIPIYQREDFL